MSPVVTKNIGECRALWEKHSPNKYIWDLWDINYALLNPDIHEPYFIHLEDSAGSGLLPLWYDQEEKEYTFFGGRYPDNRDLWIPQHLLAPLVQAIPQSADLVDISEEAVLRICDSSAEHLKYFKEDDVTYYLNLDSFGYDIEKYLDGFSKKHRKNLKYDLRKLTLAGYTLNWDNDSRSIDQLIALNQLRFGNKSNLNSPAMIQEFKALTQYAIDNDMLITATVSLGREIVGVETAILFNNTYHLINGGFDISHPNVGKMLIFSHIDKAMSLKAKIMDFMVGQNPWKELWNLTPLPVYKLQNTQNNK